MCKEFPNYNEKNTLNTFSVVRNGFPKKFSNSLFLNSMKSKHYTNLQK